MRQENSFYKWRASLLGAVNGLIYSLVLMQVLRFYNQSQRERDVELMERLNVTIQITYDYVNWKVAIFGYIFLFAIASYVVHRYWAKRLKSLVAIWMAIGVTAIVGYNVIVLVVTWLEMWITGRDLPYGLATSPIDIRFGPISLALVMATSLVYAIIIQLSSTLYSRIFQLEA